MKNERQNMNGQFFPFGIPSNMMMFPNYMNDNYSNLENKVSMLEKKVKVLENKVQRLENPYGMNNTQQIPYQTTQNNNNYNDEMYMM